MPNSQNDPLFTLIKSLNKAEKRHFQLYVNKYRSAEDALFIQLFNALDKLKDYDEEAILKKVPGIKKRQLSNLKGHLYKHLLSSLRQLYKQKDSTIDLREQLDYARVLYDKGLYQQSLKLLSRAKSQAIEKEDTTLRFEIIEFEKLIESRHITRSLENRAEELNAESRIVNQQLNSLSNLSTLSLSLYRLYLKMGHARNENDHLMMKTFFELNLSQVAPEKMSFYEKIYLYQAHCWYYYVLQDFLMYYRYTQKWVDLFHEYPILKKTDPGLYIKAKHNLLTAHFYNSNYDKFCDDLEKLEDFLKENYDGFNENIKATSFVYLYTAKINKHFLEGTFDEGLRLVPEIQQQLCEHHLQVDQHRVLVFDYKIACLYFGSGDNGTAIDYLNKVINLKVGSLRSDIQCFARILHLIVHYELEHYSLAEYLIKSVYHFIAKNKDLGAVMETILQFLKKAIYLQPKELKSAFIDLKRRLISISKNPYEKRSFLYLDIISWLESKIEDLPVQEVIHRKFLEHVPRI